MNFEKLKKDFEENERKLDLHEAMYLNLSYFNHKNNVSELVNKFDNAEKLNKNECTKCGACCWKMPCSFSFEEIKRVAEFIEITEKALFMTLLTINPYSDKIYNIIGVRQHQICNGNVLPKSEFYSLISPCKFLKDNKCLIHEVKPKTSRLFKCWEETDINSPKYSKEEILEYLKSINE